MPLIIVFADCLLIAVIASNRQHSQARTGIPAIGAKSPRTPRTIHKAARYWQTALEADLQDLTSIAHEPSSFRSRKSHRPEAAHSGQREPSVSLIGSPGR